MNVWRSYLFVPAAQLPMVKKAVSSQADSVIIDLEDAVAHSEKNKARELVIKALSELKEQKPIYVRINDIATPYWEEDLAACVRHGARGVMVPKSESEKGTYMVCQKVRETLEELKTESRHANFEVIPLLETAKGIQFAYEIARCDPLVSTLAFGSIDFSLDIGCELTSTGEELLYARSRMVVAARAAEKGQPIDAVYPDLQNLDGLRVETASAKNLGFRGKLIIHPKQIETVHEVMAPSEREMMEAREIVEAFEKAEQQGFAAISVNNRFVDYPVYKKAKEMLR